MNAYRAPVPDILFTLREIAGADQLPDWDESLWSEVAGAFAVFAENEIAPLNAPGDAQGCRIEDRRVLMPDGFPELYEQYANAGWQGMAVPEDLGGMGLPGLLQCAVSEIFSGANHSLQMVVNLVPGATSVLQKYGTREQQESLIPLLASGSHLASMCITEPGAGSDLSRIRCKATEVDGAWQISGEKIFISGGDQNLSEGIIHLVLASTGGEGIRGLSLFACQSVLADGSRNRVSVERIEEKMGLHASPTCQLHFDGARAEIIGSPGDGLRCMFAMMNHARLDVALQGVAHASRAHAIASAYAAERLQGTDSEGRAATIDQHVDVRQMLDDMAALALGCRAMAYTVLVLIESGEQRELVDFLTPVVKVFCTEAATTAAALGQQVLGGYGYLTEYGIDQIYRDARITAIYEGTNGIHAKSLLGRELARGEGADMFRALIGDCVNETSNEKLEYALHMWDEARASVEAAGYPLGTARDFMQLTGNLLFMAQWARILECADGSPSPAQYRGAGTRVMQRVPHEITSLSGKLHEELNGA